MVKIVKLERANDGKHKWIAYFDDGKKTRFGQAGADDFTLTKNEEQKKRYLARHQKDLRTNDPRRAGYLSYYVLWNKPTIEASVKDFNEKFSSA
jgi:hypothetical protein